MREIVEALAGARDQPQAVFAALERLALERVGAKLFTLMEVDRERGVARRLRSSLPQAYPVGGEKPLERDRWSEIVEERGEIFVANSIEGIARVFPDHELILSLGCASCLNLPVFVCGRLRGTLNFLHEAGHYGPGRVAAAEALKPAGALAFLLAENLRLAGRGRGK